MSLEGGYIAWLMDVMSAPEEQDKAADVEKSLRKKFKKVDLVQIYESDQHIRAGKTGR